jgi:hypothetical protein
MARVFGGDQIGIGENPDGPVRNVLQVSDRCRYNIKAGF